MIEWLIVNVEVEPKLNEAMKPKADGLSVRRPFSRVVAIPAPLHERKNPRPWQPLGQQAKDAIGRSRDDHPFLLHDQTLIAVIRHS